jgi:hypothetical protein
MKSGGDSTRLSKNRDCPNRFLLGVNVCGLLNSNTGFICLFFHLCQCKRFISSVRCVEICVHSVRSVLVCVQTKLWQILCSISVVFKFDQRKGNQAEMV